MSERRRLPIRSQSETEETLLAMVAALASELAVTRERLDTVERVLVGQRVLDRSAVEEYTAAPSDQLERDALRQRIIARVFRPVRDAAIRARMERESSQ